MKFSAIVIALAAGVTSGFDLGDQLGLGLSKSTYAGSDPITGLQFMMQNLPTELPPDECPGNICYCGDPTADDTWEVEQGRAQLLVDGDGVGFGLHLVNVSEHLTTGGMTVAEVEEKFTEKLGNMTEFDWFMDYNVGLYTSILDQYIDNFDSNKVPYLPTSWTDSSNVKWYGIFVRVPESQMVLELMSNSSTRLAGRSLHQLEPRISEQKLKELVGKPPSDILTPVSVSRAASDAASLESFYVDGMRTRVTQSVDAADHTRRCFRWLGSTVDLCFTTRQDSTTKGDWYPKDFEDMLNTVHSNLLEGQPNCNLDQWLDNHYAIDLPAMSDTSYVVDYLEANDVDYFCMKGTLHYIVDPTGWSIQTDFIVPTQPSGCIPAITDDDYVNPACNAGICKN